MSDVIPLGIVVASCGGDGGNGAPGEKSSAPSDLQAGETRVHGRSAREYLRSSIVVPDNDAADRLDAGRRPSEVLADAEIDVFDAHPEDR